MYIVKLGFTGYTLFFLFLLKNIDWGYSLEPPRRGGSNEYQQSMFWAEIWKKIRILIWKFSVFWWWNFQYIWIGVFSLWLSLSNWAQHVSIKWNIVLLNYSTRTWDREENVLWFSLKWRQQGNLFCGAIRILFAQKYFFHELIAVVSCIHCRSERKSPISYIWRT